MKIPRQEMSKLKALVRDFMAGQVFFSSQVREPNMVPMVFMPIALGFPEAPPEAPEEPKRPERFGFGRPKYPTRPKPDVDAVLPRITARISDTRRVVEEIEFQVRWGDATGDALDIARKALAEAEAAQDNVMYEAEVVADEKHLDLLFDYLDANMGVIYAYMKDAGTMAINGYPIFFGCALLHKADWEIVRAAIEREQARDIDLGDDPQGTVQQEAK